MFRDEIVSPNVPKAIGPYSAGLKVGDFVYLSGQLPINAHTNEMSNDIEQQTRQVLENIQSLLAQRFLELRHIVKTTVYLTDLSLFDKVNKVYSEFFSAPYPARSCVEVKALPKGAKIEIECFAIDTLALESIQGCCGGNCNDSHDCQCDGNCDNNDECCHN